MAKTNLRDDIPELTPEMKELAIKHKSELVVLLEQLDVARAKLIGAGGEDISDYTFMQLIRLVYPGNRRESMNFLQLIEADHASIRHALAGGEYKFFSVLASMQNPRGRSAA